MADHMRAELVTDALEMALARRRPEPGLIHHSDQGSQYVTLGFGQQARDAGIAHLDGLAAATAYDNAVAESFFATLKKELDPPPLLADQARARHRGLRLHRGLLQPRTPPLHARHALPRRVRAAPLRCEEPGNPPPRTSIKQCRLNRGKSSS